MHSGGNLRIRLADSIEWRRRKQPGIRITIADTGSGMSPDVIRRIAVPFFTTREASAPASACGSFTN